MKNLKIAIRLILSVTLFNNITNAQTVISNPHFEIQSVDMTEDGQYAIYAGKNSVVTSDGYVSIYKNDGTLYATKNFPKGNSIDAYVGVEASVILDKNECYVSGGVDVSRSEFNQALRKYESAVNCTLEKKTYGMVFEDLIEKQNEIYGIIRTENFSDNLATGWNFNTSSKNSYFCKINKNDLSIDWEYRLQDDYDGSLVSEGLGYLRFTQILNNGNFMLKFLLVDGTAKWIEIDDSGDFVREIFTGTEDILNLTGYSGEIEKLKEDPFTGDFYFMKYEIGTNIGGNINRQIEHYNQNLNYIDDIGWEYRFYADEASNFYILEDQLVVQVGYGKMTHIKKGCFVHSYISEFFEDHSMFFKNLVVSDTEIFGYANYSTSNVSIGGVDLDDPVGIYSYIYTLNQESDETNRPILNTGGVVIDKYQTECFGFLKFLNETDYNTFDYWDGTESDTFDEIPSEWFSLPDGMVVGYPPRFRYDTENGWFTRIVIRNDVPIGTNRVYYSLFVKFTTDNLPAKITEQKNGVSIYPNPVKNILRINSNENIISANVLNISGKTVLQSKNSKNIDIVNLVKGIYFLQIKTQNNIELLRFVVE